MQLLCDTEYEFETEMLKKIKLFPSWSNFSILFYVINMYINVMFEWYAKLYIYLCHFGIWLKRPNDRSIDTPLFCLFSMPLSSISLNPLYIAIISAPPTAFYQRGFPELHCVLGDLPLIRLNYPGAVITVLGHRTCRHSLGGLVAATIKHTLSSDFALIRFNSVCLMTQLINKLFVNVYYFRCYIQ